MADYRISVDLGGLASIRQVINRDVFPLLNQAVRAVAFQTAKNWKQAVMEAKLWSGEKDAYVKSITWTMTGDLSAVVQADYRHAEEIEKGRPQRDLKKMLDTSLKVRASKQGVRYLYIPFRHNTPGHGAWAKAMPPNIYEMAKEMAPSTVVGKKQRRSGTGAYDIKTKKFLTVNQNTYQWGGRLPAGLAPKLNPTHKTDPYAGMVRFNTSTPNAKSSAYLTFRTMSEKSKGWIVPAKPGLFIAKQVVDNMKPLAGAAFTEAIKRSLD
jgi:hypothetical protein